MRDGETTKGAPPARAPTEAPDAPIGLRRWLVSSFLVAILAVMGIWGLPKFSPVQDAWVRYSDPAVTWLGLWQMSWPLFGPSPDDMNVAITGVVCFDDGTRVEWRSPDWRALSVSEKFRWFRHAEYTDGARRDANWAAWAPLARYLARTQQHPDPAATARPVSVRLWRRWVRIPEPTEPLRAFDDPFPLVNSLLYHVETIE